MTDMIARVLLAAALLMPVALSAGAQGAPDGARLFQQRCSACHSLAAEKRSGPSLGALSGRAAGTSPGFTYTPALRDSGLVWDAATLDRWLTNPAALVRGTRMTLRVPRETDRAAIVGFLLGQ
jgi:cytochrome c